jgi:hypothetical protein
MEFVFELEPASLEIELEDCELFKLEEGLELLLEDLFPEIIVLGLNSLGDNPSVANTPTIEIKIKNIAVARIVFLLIQSLSCVKDVLSCCYKSIINELFLVKLLYTIKVLDWVEKNTRQFISPVECLEQSHLICHM